MSEPAAPHSKRERPLSPHLQVYRLPMTAIMSILHRATGAALSVGSLMIVWWLIAAATSEEAFNIARNFAASPIGLFMLFGWSFSLFYHMCNGIRHLIWDTGKLFKIENANMAGYLVIFATIILTAGTWYYATKNPDVSSSQGVFDTLARTYEKDIAQ